MAEKWSIAQKKKIQVPTPQPLQTYNKHMGRVDLLDQFVSQYRIRIHLKKMVVGTIFMGNLSSCHKWA